MDQPRVSRPVSPPSVRYLLTDICSRKACVSTRESVEEQEERGGKIVHDHCDLEPRGSNDSRGCLCISPRYSNWTDVRSPLPFVLQASFASMQLAPLLGQRGSIFTR